MNFLLKIVGERKSGPLRKCDGYSRMRYVFYWNPKLEAYTYVPKDQKEVDDLYKNKNTYLRYAPVELDPTPAEAPTAPSADNEQSEAPVLDDALTEQCLHRGIIVTDDDTNETAQRLIAAYDKGATDTLTSVAKMPKARKAKPEAEPA